MTLRVSFPDVFGMETWTPCPSYPCPKKWNNLLENITEKDDQAAQDEILMIIAS